MAAQCSPLPSSGGYDDDIFVDPPKEHDGFDCPVCLLVLKEPHLLSCCGKHACEVCIQRIKCSSTPCPCCREEQFITVLNKGLKGKILELKIHCSNKGTGCNWTGELGDARRHLETKCDYVEETCPYGCGEKLLRHALQTHKTRRCTRRPLEVQLECLSEEMMEKLNTLEAKYEEKVTVLEKKLKEQEKKTKEQEKKVIEQEKKMIGQEKKTKEQEEKAIEQEKKAIEQEKKAIEQEKKMIEQEKRTKEQEKKVIEQEKKMTKQEERFRKEQTEMNGRFQRDLEEERKRIAQVIKDRPIQLQTMNEQRLTALETANTVSINTVGDTTMQLENMNTAEIEVPVTKGQLACIQASRAWFSFKQDLETARVRVKFNEGHINIKYAPVMEAKATLDTLVASVQERTIDVAHVKKEILEYLFKSKEGEVFVNMIQTSCRVAIEVDDNRVHVMKIIKLYGMKKDVLAIVESRLSSIVNNKEVTKSIHFYSVSCFDVQKVAQTRNVTVSDYKFTGGAYDVQLVEDYITIKQLNKK